MNTSLSHSRNDSLSHHCPVHALARRPARPRSREQGAGSREQGSGAGKKNSGTSHRPPAKTRTARTRDRGPILDRTPGIAGDRPAGGRA